MSMTPEDMKKLMFISLVQRLFILKAGTLAVLVLGGCTPPSGNSGVPMSTYQKPELLYLLPEPCSRLYVEIDSVEGSNPPPEALLALKGTLERYCDKPGGIEIVRHDPIPLSNVRGKSSRLIALQYMDGPPKELDDGQTAYLYVLFFNTMLQGSKSEKSHVGRYYRAVWINLAYGPKLLYEHYPTHTINHELGHVLGLCKNLDHGDGTHCRNNHCIMSTLGLQVPMRTWLLGIAPPTHQDKFCEDCLADLEAAKADRPDSRMSFFGPLLVRREQGYAVATAPYCTLLSFNRDGERDWLELLAKAKELSHTHANLIENRPGARFQLKHGMNELNEKRDIVESATKDPDPHVAQMAKESLKQIGN